MVESTEDPLNLTFNKFNHQSAMKDCPYINKNSCITNPTSASTKKRRSKRNLRQNVKIDGISFITDKFKRNYYQEENNPDSLKENDKIRVQNSSNINPHKKEENIIKFENTQLEVTKSIINNSIGLSGDCLVSKRTTRISQEKVLNRLIYQNI